MQPDCSRHNAHQLIWGRKLSSIYMSCFSSPCLLPGLGPSYPCTNGDVRLTGGSDRRGRLEMCVGGTWGSVCNNFQWHNTDAQVVCRQLGYNASGECHFTSYVDRLLLFSSSFVVCCFCFPQAIAVVGFPSSTFVVVFLQLCCCFPQTKTVVVFLHAC